MGRNMKHVRSSMTCVWLNNSEFLDLTNTVL